LGKSIVFDDGRSKIKRRKTPDPAAAFSGTICLKRLDKVLTIRPSGPKLQLPLLDPPSRRKTDLDTTGEVYAVAAQHAAVSSATAGRRYPAGDGSRKNPK
jgi:hypothetical protein